MSDQTGGEQHYPAGGTKAPRKTTIIESHNNNLMKKTVDGEVKSNPQPH